MDYATLRQEGLRLLELFNGGKWTDFNSHDPGITLLEQLCYALSDLSYRIGFDLPDLLAEGGSAPYASLPPPQEILPCGPVSPLDLRRIVLDVEGVQNAWVEPLRADAPDFFHLPAAAALRLSTEDVSAQPIRLRGLYRVLIAPRGDPSNGQVRADVAKRLHACRGLGEDFAEIKVLDTQLVKVDAVIEIDPVDDPTTLLRRIRDRLAEEIAPTVPFSSLAELLTAGMPVDEIFEGPLLTHGFLPARVLEGASRRKVIHTSDLLRAIMAHKGVRAVSRLRIKAGGKWESWSLVIDEDRVPLLDGKNLSITLRQRGRILTTGSLSSADSGSTASSVAYTNPLAPPSASNRSVYAYSSVQKQLPVLYGVGDGGLPDSVTTLRKAQARQLRAYLMFFEQIMANSFAQLAHVKDLFSQSSEARTYFTQVITDSALPLDEIRALEGHGAKLQALIEVEGSDAALERQNRFLNHLLARVGEPLADYVASGTLAVRAARKKALLRSYASLSSTRGTGFNCLSAAIDNVSGLEARLRIDLGLSEVQGETVILVEHILLRPIGEDQLYDDQWLPLALEAPLLAAPRQPDPYSLRVTFALPIGNGRFIDPLFRANVEQLLRERTPAYLVAYVHWMEAAVWTAFVTEHTRWRTLLREYRAAGVQVQLTDVTSRTIAPRALELRGARDRLIDLLELGQTYPLPDPVVMPSALTIPSGSAATIEIWPTQPGVRYALYESQTAVASALPIDGTGEREEIEGPPISAATTYQVRAHKIDHPERALLLLDTAPVKIG